MASDLSTQREKSECVGYSSSNSRNEPGWRGRSRLSSVPVGSVHTLRSLLTESMCVGDREVCVQGGRRYLKRRRGPWCWYVLCLHPVLEGSGDEDNEKQHHTQVQVRLIFIWINGVADEAEDARPDEQEREEVRVLHEVLWCG